MSETLRITSSETAQFLQEKYGSGIVDIKQIGEGGWSLAFAFVHKGASYVIRWSDVADNFERDAVAARFTSNDLPVPPIIEIGRGVRHPGYPSSRVPTTGCLACSRCSSAST